MTFVVDASVALAWALADEQSDVADYVLARLLSEDALAPAIWPLEVANGLRTAERRGRLTAAELPRLRDLFAALPVSLEVVDMAAALGEVQVLARLHDLTAYDAAYLAVAIRHGLPLATSDDRLAVAAGAAGLALVD